MKLILILSILFNFAWSDSEEDQLPLVLGGSLMVGGAVAGKKALDRNPELKELNEQLEGFKKQGIHFSDLDIELLKRKQPNTVEVFILKLRRKVVLREKANLKGMSIGLVGLGTGLIVFGNELKSGAAILDSSGFSQKIISPATVNEDNNNQHLDPAK